MKMTKKLLSIVLGAAMCTSLTLPAMADTTTEAGTANVLDYHVKTVVAPTSLKVALNPAGYEFTIGYELTEDDDVDTSKKYYTKSGDTYTYVSSPKTDDIATYYEATTKTDQVISLNYGLANKSTDKMYTEVTLTASYTAGASGTDITFVDTEAEVTAAKKDELKMYLEIVAAKAQPTLKEYYELTEDTKVTSGKKYYVVDASAADGYKEVASPSDDDIATYYEKKTDIGKKVTAAQLGDVVMENATEGKVSLEAVDGEEKTTGKMAFGLDKATYTLQKDKVIDFTTTQDKLSELLEMSALGDSTGFTITGKLNSNADWSKANATSITITPTYKVVIPDEELTEDGGFKQVEVVISDLEPSADETVNLVAGTDAVINVDFGKGTKVATAVTSVMWDGQDLLGGLVTYADNKLTVSSTAVDYVIGDPDASDTLTVKFNDADETTVDVTMNRP